MNFVNFSMGRSYGTISLHNELIAAINAEIAMDGLYLNTTDFVREAVREKLERRRSDRLDQRRFELKSSELSTD